MSIQSVRSGRQRAPLRAHAQGAENKELQTQLGVLLIVYIRSQRVGLIEQAITSDAAYSAALHNAWVMACPTPAAHTLCLAPPQLLSQPAPCHASPAPAAAQLIRTPWHHLISYLHVSHRLQFELLCKTVVLGLRAGGHGLSLQSTRLSASIPPLGSRPSTLASLSLGVPRPFHAKRDFGGAQAAQVDELVDGKRGRGYRSRDHCGGIVDYGTFRG
jgi:hypothetical protein